MGSYGSYGSDGHFGLSVDLEHIPLEHIPDPPTCLFDCPLFNLISLGEVDDCDTISLWSGDVCFEDCSVDDVHIWGTITSLFCGHLLIPTPPPTEKYSLSVCLNCPLGFHQGHLRKTRHRQDETQTRH